MRTLLRASLFVVIAGIAVVGADAAPVTYRTTAKTVRAVIADLAATTKQQLFTSPEVGGEVVIVDVKDVDSEDLLTRLAGVVCGKWHDEGAGKRRLYLDHARDTRITQKMLAERTNRVQKSLTDYLTTKLGPEDLGSDSMDVPDGAPESAQPAKDASADTAKADAAKSTDKKPAEAGKNSKKPKPKSPPRFQNFMPYNTAPRELFQSLVRQIPVRVIAGIEAGERIVWATNPTAMQRPINVDTVLLTKFIDQQNKSIRESEAVVPENGAASGDTTSNPWLEMFRSQQPKVLVGAPAKVELVIENASESWRKLMMGTGYQLTLRIFNSKGEITQAYNDFLPLSGPEMVVSAAPRGGARPQVTRAVSDDKQAEKAIEDEVVKITEGSVALSENTKEISAASPGVGNVETMMTAKYSDRLIELLQSPTQYDPLSFKFSDQILTTASLNHWNVVACAPDSVGDWAAASMTNEQADLKVRPFYRSILTNTNLESTVSDGWWTVQPKFPALTRQDRLNRGGLETFLKACAPTKRVPTLEVLANYAAVNQPFSETQLAMPYVMAFCPNILVSTMQSSKAWKILGLYGMMGGSLQDGMKRGGAVTLGEMAKEARDLVYAHTYGYESNLETQKEIDQQEKYSDLAVFSMGFINQSAALYLNEPTDALPNGLSPRSAFTVELKSQSAAMILGDKDAKDRSIASLGITELAFIKSMMDNLPAGASMGAMPSFDRLQIGRRDIYKFKIQLGPNIFVTSTFPFDTVDPKAPVVSIKKLPADTQKELDAAMGRIKKMGLTNFGNMGRSGAEKQP